MVDFLPSEGTDLVGGESSQKPQLTPRGNAATELREAFGVRGACSRFQTPSAYDSASKLDALQTLRVLAPTLPLRFACFAGSCLYRATALG